MNEKTIISTKNLVCRFGSQTVLDGVNLDVKEGEVLVIMGGSGSGKSTLLRHMIGTFIPDEGTVEMFGEDMISSNPESGGSQHLSNIAKFASMLNDPMSTLVRILNATMNKFAGTLQSLKEQKQ